MTNKNPVSAAAMGAALGSVFSIFGADRKIAMMAGAVGGVALSLFGAGHRAVGSPYIAPAVRKRRNLDEYYDTLTYVKYRRLAAQEERLAKDDEHVDINDIDGSKEGNVSKDQKEYVEGLRRTRQDLKARQGGL